MIFSLDSKKAKVAFLAVGLDFRKPLCEFYISFQLIFVATLIHRLVFSHCLFFL